jgi:MoxR-like ATPase
MFNIWLDYPSFDEEIRIVKATTTEKTVTPEVVISAEEILHYQNLVRKIPVPDNVFSFAVNLVSCTRPRTAKANPWANEYLTWGAGPRASQYLILGAKCHAALSGKYSPDTEDIKAVATSVLRHRIVRNYKAEAEGISVEDIVHHLLNSIAL